MCEFHSLEFRNWIYKHKSFFFLNYFLFNFFFFFFSCIFVIFDEFLLNSGSWAWGSCFVRLLFWFTVKTLSEFLYSMAFNKPFHFIYLFVCFCLFFFHLEDINLLNLSFVFYLLSKTREKVRFLFEKWIGKKTFNSQFII